MTEIKLSRGLIALVDEEDFSDLSNYKWYALKINDNNYAARNIRKENGKQTLILMHRQVMNLFDKLLQVDHKDHNGLNNHKNNLRVCPCALNNKNSVSRKGSASKFLGVTKRKRNKKWEAAIFVNSKGIYLGTFEFEIDAAKAYDAAAKIHFGEYANLNFK